VIVVDRLPRSNISSGFPLTWKVRIGRDGVPEDPLRVRFKCWAWKYRQSSYGAPTFTGTAVADHTHTQGATGGAGGHDHGAIETDGVDATPGAHQTLRTYPGSGVNSSLLAGVATAGQAAATIRTDSVADHTHTNPDTGAAGGHPPSGTISNPGAAMNEETAPNANLTVRIGGVYFKTGLCDGTEKLLFDEIVTDKFPAGEVSIEFICGANGAVGALLEVTY